MVRAIGAGLVVLGLAACGASEPEPPAKVRDLAHDARLLGIAVSPSSQDYGEALSDAVTAGLQVFEIPQQWREFETAENQAIVRQLNELLSAHGARVVLSLNPLDTLDNQIPDDLRGERFDADRFVERFDKFATEAMALLPDVEVVAIAVGNEVDVLLGDDTEKWGGYARFFEAARKRLRSRLPDTPVGVKLTYDGFRNRRKHVDTLVARSDLAMITYYPVGDDRVRDIASVRPEIESILAAYPDKLLHMSEIGYPTSPALSSSEEKQAEFVSEMFALWDDYPRVALMNFVWINDIAPQAARTLVREFGATNPTFVEFLSTLGLRSDTGEPKAGFLRLVSEVERRRQNATTVD